MSGYECNGTNISWGERCYWSIQQGKADLNGELHLPPNEKFVPLHELKNIHFIITCSKI